MMLIDDNNILDGAPPCVRTMLTLERLSSVGHNTQGFAFHVFLKKKYGARYEGIARKICISHTYVKSIKCTVLELNVNKVSTIPYARFVQSIKDNSYIYPCLHMKNYCKKKECAKALYGIHKEA